MFIDEMTTPAKPVKATKATKVTKAANTTKATGAAKAAKTTASRGPAIIVRDSPVHGKGVFAARDIKEGARIIEYKGEIITTREADRRESLKAADDFHTFFFSLESGKIIDGGKKGNNARWINHSCAPNCEAREDEGRVFIHALRDLKEGEELNYDYGLILEQRHTKAIKKAYECRCGAKNCRHTLLAPKKR